MGANDPRGGAIFVPRGMIGMIGRIYKKDHYTLLHTKYEGSVAMETRVPIRPGTKPNATFPPPQ